MPRQNSRIRKTTPREAGTLAQALRASLMEIRNRRDEYERLNALVNGARVLDEVLARLEPLTSLPEPTYSLAQAASLCGYTADHLGRLVRAGKIPNRGRPQAPRVCISECPRRDVDFDLPVRSASSAPED